MTQWRPIRINGRTYESPLALTDGYRRGEVSLVQAAAGLSKWGWAPPRIAQALTHPSGHRGRRAAAGVDSDTTSTAGDGRPDAPRAVGVRR